MKTIAISVDDVKSNYNDGHEDVHYLIKLKHDYFVSQVEDYSTFGPYFNYTRGKEAILLTDSRILEIHEIME